MKVHSLYPNINKHKLKHSNLETLKLRILQWLLLTSQEDLSLYEINRKSPGQKDTHKLHE